MPFQPGISNRVSAFFCGPNWAGVGICSRQVIGRKPPDGKRIKSKNFSMWWCVDETDAAILLQMKESFENAKKFILE
jgi:hypothetical protein